MDRLDREKDEIKETKSLTEKIKDLEEESIRSEGLIRNLRRDLQLSTNNLGIYKDQIAELRIELATKSEEMGELYNNIHTLNHELTEKESDMERNIVENMRLEETAKHTKIITNGRRETK